DIGTGSGAIALALASNLPESEVLGIDVSPSALAIAKQNRELLALTNLHFSRADILASNWPKSNQARYDLVVSNPPYVSLDDFNSLAPELLFYEPRHALTDEASGLTFYKK